LQGKVKKHSPVEKRVTDAKSDRIKEYMPVHAPISFTDAEKKDGGKRASLSASKGPVGLGEMIARNWGKLTFLVAGQDCPGGETSPER